MAILTDAMGNQIGYEDDAPVDQPLAQPSENSPLHSAINKVKHVATNYNPLMVMKSLQDLARTTVINPAVGALGAAQGLVRSVPDVANDISNYAQTGEVNRTGLNTATDLANRFNQMHMQPAQTPLGQNFEDYLAKKAPDTPILPMSPRGGIIGNMTGLEERRPLVSPSDVRAAIGKAQIVGGELRDLPQDFRNAQSGIQKQNILGEPTLGVKAQGVADSIGDIMAKRQMQGLPPVPGIPAELQPRTNLYAVRPEGSPMLSATTQKVSLDRGGMDEVIRDILPYGPVLDQDSANALYRYHVIGENHHEAFENFKRQKAQEEFPNLSANDAERAVDYKYPGREHDDYMKNMMNEFATANGLISVDQLAENHQKGVNALTGPFKQYISKYLGTEKDPLLNEALKGITMRASDDLASMSTPNEDIEHARTKFNPNMPLGTVTPKIVKKQEEIAKLQKESDDRQETRDKLHQQAVSEGYARPMTYPGAKENIKALEKVNTALQRAHTDMDNLKIAHNYENMADDALRGMTAEKMWSKIPPPERQFYPQLEHLVNTQPHTTVYDVRAGALHRLGVKQIGDEIYNRLLTGKMTEKELARTPIDALVRDVTKERIAKELEAKKSLVARKEKISSIYKDDLSTIPPQNHFGNAHVKEIDSNMSPEEIEFWLSGETEILDHCVAKGIDRPSHKHTFTGAERNYLPLTDISTQSAENPWGKRFSETTRKNLTGFISNAMNGDTKFGSLRDSKTGMPVGLVEFSDMRQDASGKKTYQIGYATQHHNKDIDPQYRNSLRDYLNAKSDEIRNMDTTDKSGVYDTKALSARFLAGKANMSEEAFRIASEAHGLPRFVTQEDLMDLKNHNPPPASVVAVRRQHGNNDRLHELEATRRQLDDDLNELDRNDFPSEEDYLDARHDLEDRMRDATQRHINLTRRLEQEHPGLTNNARYLIGAGDPLVPIPNILASTNNYRIHTAYRRYLQDLYDEGLNNEDIEQSLITSTHEINYGRVAPTDHDLNTDAELAELGHMLEAHSDAVQYYFLQNENMPQRQGAQQAIQPYQFPDIAGLRQEIPLLGHLNDAAVETIHDVATSIINGNANPTHGRRSIEQVISTLQGGINFAGTRTSFDREGVATALQHYLDRTDPAQQQPVQQLAQQPAQQPAQPYREPTELQRVIAGMQNTPTTRLRDAMGDHQANEVDILANDLFGSYDHREVANIIHSLRTGTPAIGDDAYSTFSMRQRELLARELERRLPVPEPQPNNEPTELQRVSFQGALFGNSIFEDNIRGGIDNVDSTIYALHSDVFDHPTIRNLTGADRRQFIQSAIQEMTRLADEHDLDAHRQPMASVSNAYIAHHPAAVRVYNDIIAVLPENASLQGIHDHLTHYVDGITNVDDIDLPAYGIQSTRDVAPIIQMLDEHIRSVDLALAAYESRRATPNLLEPDDQHGANQPELGVNPAYQIETVQTSLPAPVIDFLEAFFRNNNIDSHPENILEESYRDLLEQIEDRERGTLWELTPRQREEALSHVDTVMQNMGLNVDTGDWEVDNQHGANQPAQAPEPQNINAAITQAYTEPLQLATTPVSYSMMGAAIEHVNTMANNMFGQGYTPSEIAQSAINRFTNIRNDIVRSTPEALRINRTEYDDYLSMLRRAIDHLGPYVQFEQQAPIPEAVQQHIANADVLPRRIQTAALADLQGELSTREINEAREFAARVAHPNNANTPTDLRAIAQTARQYSAGQPWRVFNPAQRELLARALEQHATDIELRQQP